MKWCTEVKIEFPWLYRHRERYLFLGSCFAAAVGSRLQDWQLPAWVNPCGTLFHPLAIAQSLNRAIKCLDPDPLDLIEYEGRFWSLLHHGDAHPSAPPQSREELLPSLRRCDQALADAMRSCDHLILSFGSAWLYQRQGRPVANCHQLPGSWFQRRCCDVDEMLAPLEAALASWMDSHPQARLTLTVSPIRHLRDKPQENSRSKARLQLLCEALEKRFPGRSWTFPSWELVIDELRDYRFYGEDLSHLTSAAEDYVAERFIAGFDDEGRQYLRDGAELHRLSCHRPRDAARHAELLAQARQRFDERWRRPQS
jgi:hypothetical protein